MWKKKEVWYPIEAISPIGSLDSKIISEILYAYEVLRQYRPELLDGDHPGRVLKIRMELVSTLKERTLPDDDALAL